MDISKIIIKQKCGETINNNLIKSAALFFAKKLIKKKILNNIKKIEINLTKMRVGEGEVELPICKKNNVIKIKINRCSEFTEIISSLAHEFVHIKQALDGKLTTIAKNGMVYWKWNGKCYGTDVYDMIDVNDHYKKLPWETEAYNLETKLAKSFFNNHFSSTY